MERLLTEATEALTKGRFGRALQAYEALEELEPSAAVHWLRAADCLARLGRKTEAVAAYCEAARRYEAAGREAQGHAVWRLAHALDPSHRRAANGLLAAETILAAAKMLPVPPRAPSPDPVVIDVCVTESLLSAALDADVARARRFGLALSVLVLELTPRAPASAAPAVEACLRTTDTVASLPSGRLVVVALGASASGANRIAEKLRRTLAALSPPVEATAGIAPLVDVSDSARICGRELLAHADTALERALAAGHHTSVASSHWLDTTAATDVSLA